MIPIDDESWRWMMIESVSERSWVEVSEARKKRPYNFDRRGVVKSRLENGGGRVLLQNFKISL